MLHCFWPVHNNDMVAETARASLLCQAGCFCSRLLQLGLSFLVFLVAFSHLWTWLRHPIYFLIGPRRCEREKVIVHQWAGSVKPASQLSINACRDLCERTVNPSWNKSADDTLMKFCPAEERKGLHSEYCCCVRSRWISPFHQSHRGYCAGVKLLSSLSPTPR